MSEIIEETNNSVENFSVNGADSVAIVYSNTAKPGFEIIYFNAQKKEIGSKKVKLDADQIVDGLPIPTLNLESMLKQYIPAQVKSVDVLLDSDSIFKVTNVYPKINFFKLSQVYAQDMKEAHGDVKDKFKCFFSKEVLVLITATIHYDLLEHNTGMLGTNGQLMDVARSNRQFHNLLNNTTGYRWIELRIHIRLTVNQCLVEVDGLRL